MVNTDAAKLDSLVQLEPRIEELAEGKIEQQKRPLEFAL
jgi:hypothetical protein